MQNIENDAVAHLFSESGRQNSEGYLVVLSQAQQILDAIAAGEPELAVRQYDITYPNALPADDNSMWIDHLLLFRQMQACMVLGLLLHHGYLLQLPGQALYTIFETATNRLMYMKTPDEAHEIMTVAVRDMALLVKRQNRREFHPAVQKAIEFMAAHNEPLTAEQIAQAAGLSAGRLNELFRKCTGKSIHTYLVDGRLEMARLLLLATNKSVSAIASELGFASASHLGTLFKAREGMTPSQYRLQQRQLGGTE